MLKIFLSDTGNKQKQECLAVQGTEFANFVFDANCAEQRRHFCMMEPKSVGTCDALYHNLAKCVKYFPDAGLLDKVHADAFCQFNRGSPPKVSYHSSDPAFDSGNLLFLIFKCNQCQY